MTLDWNSTFSKSDFNTLANYTDCTTVAAFTSFCRANAGLSSKVSAIPAFFYAPAAAFTSSYRATGASSDTYSFAATPASSYRTNVSVSGSAPVLPNKVATLLQRYPQVFDSSIGRISNVQANLCLKENARPVFIKARKYSSV